MTNTESMKRRREIIRRYLAGEPKESLTDTGLSAHTIQKYLQNAGVLPPRSRMKERVGAASDLAAKGHHATEIARRMKVHVSYIRNLSREFGFPIAGQRNTQPQTQ